VTDREPAPRQPSVLIFGAGAVGSFLGARLAQAGANVTLLGRPQQVAAVGREGVRLQVAGSTTSQAVKAAPELAAGQGRFDYVLLTVKSYDTPEALDQLYPALLPGTVLGTFQNGVGNEELIAHAYPDQALLSGTLTLAVTLDEPGLVVQHTRRGGVGIAPVSPEVNVGPLVRKMAEAGFASRRYSNFRSMKWSKLLGNMLGNVQSAILDLPPTHVFADPELFRYERLAFREAAAVMDRMRIPVTALPGIPVHSLRRVMGLPSLLAQMILEPQIGGARGNKMPSLWWDLQRGKGRTEVRVLNGAVVDAGARVAVPTPVNSVLWAIMEQVTASATEWERYRRQPARLKALLRTATRL
jgi:2-dehydropantoate 2-reductase